MSAMPAALDTHRIDVVLMTAPAIDDAMATGKYRVLEPVLNQIAPRWMFSAIIANRDWAKANRDTVKRVASVVEASAAYTNAHHVELSPQIAALVGASVNSVAHDDLADGRNLARPGRDAAGDRSLGQVRLHRKGLRRARHDLPMNARLGMAGGNKLKLGLFGANCSGGRALTRVPERWKADWDEIAAMAQMADDVRDRLPAADRPLERLRRRDRLARHELRNAHLGHRTARAHQTHHGLRHRARAAVSPDQRGEADGHRRSRRTRPFRTQHRRRLERGRVRDVRRGRRKSAPGATIKPKSGSTPSRRSGRATISTTSASTTSCATCG